MSEKRRFPRYGIASLAEIYLSSGETIEAFVSSISMGGVGIYSPSRIEVGTDLDVKISFLQTNGNEEVTEIIPGRVAWIREFYHNYVIGISFTTLDTVKHAKLLDYLEAANRGSA